MAAPTNLVIAAALDVDAPGQDLLDGLVAVFNLMEVELPARVGLVPGGEVAFDADQFTVNLASITRGQPGQVQTQATTPSMLLQFVTYEVYLLRAVATIQDGVADDVTPTPGVLASDYHKLAVDARNLWRAIVSLHASYALVSPNVPFTYGPLQMVGPEGGLSGSKVAVNWTATDPFDG